MKQCRNISPVNHSHCDYIIMDTSMDNLLDSEEDQHPSTPCSSTSTKKKLSSKKSTIRARNFTKEEVEVLLREAGKHSKTLKGRFQPNCTNEIKHKKWMEISKLVNSIDGMGDRTWQHCRKKWQDLICTARGKYRNQLHESRKTGGGPSTAERLTRIEQIAIESVGEVSVMGITGGVDSNDTSYVSLLGDSEISFDTPAANAPESDSTTTSPSLFSQDQISPLPLFSNASSHNPFQNTSTPTLLHPVPVHLTNLNLKIRNRLIAPQLTAPPRLIHAPPTTAPQLVAPVLATPPSGQPRTTTPRAPPAVPRLPPLQSNRTVTRDLRRVEFKEMMKIQEENNKLMRKLILFKRNKAIFEYGEDFLEGTSD